ncbi:MAG: hypothetical protein ACKOBZ_01035 [Nitrospira sp.]
MRKRTSISRFGVVCVTVVSALACLPGCAIPVVPSRVVLEDPANFVRLELDSRVIPEEPDTSHDHPATVAPELMADILRGLSVRDHRLALYVWAFGLAPTELAFSEAEIQLVAAKLSEGLADATPTECVTFYLSYPQTSVKREITSGSLYIKTGYLHFTLSNHREIYGIPAYGMIYDRRYPRLPIAPKDFDVLFALPAAVVPQDASLWETIRGLEHDSVVIDLGKLNPANSVVQALP